MDEPLWAQTPNELHYYLLVTPCAQCGRGPLVPQRPEPAAAGEEGASPASRQAVVRTQCKRCNAKADFHFRWEYVEPADAADPDCINPSDEPSRIIDLGQWVGLYHMFSAEAGSSRTPAETHRASRQAWLCLAEALKFFAGEEFPPESAFVTESSIRAYRANQANYAHTHLRDLQAMLPAPSLASQPAPPKQAGARAWWRFWE